MIRHRVLQLILLSIALLAQLSLLPIMMKSVSSVNPLLAFLLIIALRENRVEGLVWGALLGGLTDLFLFQHIGYHGISFLLAAYFLGLISHKMVVQGIVPVFAVSLASFLFVFSLTVGLMTIFQGNLDLSSLPVPLLLGMIFTPVLTLVFSFLYQRLDVFLTKR